MQKNPLTSKVALITGAARRIGAEIARELHAAGMNIALHYNASEDEALSLSDELNKSPALLSHCAGLLVPKGSGIGERAVKHWGRLDVLVKRFAFLSTE